MFMSRSSGKHIKRFYSYLRLLSASENLNPVLDTGEHYSTVSDLRETIPYRIRGRQPLYPTDPRGVGIHFYYKNIKLLAEQM